MTRGVNQGICFINRENSRIIPFRESKLTRLFQNFFVGQGKAAMIVNVNQLASMFDETMHVFKFSAIASKVRQVLILFEIALPPPTLQKESVQEYLWTNCELRTK